MVRIILLFLGKYICQYWGGSHEYIRVAGRFQESNQDIKDQNKIIVDIINTLNKEKQYNADAIEKLRKAREKIDLLTIKSDLIHLRLVRQRQKVMIAFNTFDRIYRKFYKDYDQIEKIEDFIIKDNFNHYAYEQGMYLLYMQKAIKNLSKKKASE